MLSTKVGRDEIMTRTGIDEKSGRSTIDGALVDEEVMVKAFLVDV